MLLSPKKYNWICGKILHAILIIANLVYFIKKMDEPGNICHSFASTVKSLHNVPHKIESKMTNSPRTFVTILPVHKFMQYACVKWQNSSERGLCTASISRATFSCTASMPLGSSPLPPPGGLYIDRYINRGKSLPFLPLSGIYTLKCTCKCTHAVSRSEINSQGRWKLRPTLPNILGETYTFYSIFVKILRIQHKMNLCDNWFSYLYSSFHLPACTGLGA